MLGKDINVGVKWNAQATCPAVGSNWCDYYIRVDAQGLAPGATGTYVLSITASNNTGSGYTTVLAAGSNNLIFDVVYESISWFGDNNGGVGPANSKFTSPAQTIVAVPAVNAGSATAAICQSGTTAALGGTFSGGATSAIWSDGGAGGSFTNNTGSSPNTATYTASATSATPVTLTLTSNAGPCTSASANKSLTVNPKPVVSAGSTTTAICQVQPQPP